MESADVRSRSFVLTVSTLVALFVLSGGLLAYDSSQRGVIANGVKIGGIDVGGLTSVQARARLRSALRSRLERPLIARYGAERFILDARASRVSVDVAASVSDALGQTREADIFTRAWRSLTGGELDSDITPQVSFSHAAVAALVRRVGARIDRAPRDASIGYAPGSIGVIGSRPGLSVDAQSLTDAIEGALQQPAAAREVQVRTVRVQPRVTSAELAARNPTIITVDRAAFTLRLYKGLRLARTYPIAVGMAGLETPAGLYHVQDKELNPSWHVPNSAWAGSLAGQTIPPGPQDPIKARWMGIFNGAGIHGTDELGSLGTAASHGCIRMAIPDVIALYDQTPLGTPVFIA